MLNNIINNFNHWIGKYCIRCKNVYNNLKNKILLLLKRINLYYYKIKEPLAVNNTIVSLPSHPYHIVDQSPWPITLSGVLLSLTISAVLSFHGYVMGDIILLCSFILLL